MKRILKLPRPCRRALAVWLILTAQLLTSLPLRGQTVVAPKSDVPKSDAPKSDAATADGALPDKLVPLRPRDESIDDRMYASARFAEGRLLFRREQFESALQRYARAYRYSNGSSTILDEVIPLAFRLGRHDQAARYAERATPSSAIDPFIMRRLALHLTEQEQFDRALALYQRVTQEQDDEPDPVPAVITQFEIGRLLYLLDRMAEAAASFEQVRVVLQQPDPTAKQKPAIEALLAERQVTFSLIAETFLASGQSQQAGEMFRSAYQDHADSPVLGFHLARVAAKQNDKDKAIELLNRYLQTGNLEAGTAPYELFIKLRGQGPGADEARRELIALSEQQDQNVFLAYFLGKLFLDRREPEPAIRHFKRLMKVRPLIDGFRGLLHARIQQDNLAEVIRLLADAAKKLGGLESLSGITDELARAPSMTKRLVATARKDFLSDDSPESDSTQRNVALAMAELLSHANDSVTADEFYERAAGTGDQADPAVWLAWGMQRLSSEQPERAIEVFEGLLKLTDNVQQQGPIEFYLAAALALDDRFDEALAAARRAADRLPNVPTIQMRPAWVLFIAHRWPEAAKAYESFLAQHGDQYGSPALRDAVREAKSSLSSVCIFLDRNDQAEEWLEQILDEFPDDVGAHNDLGYLWAERGVHTQRALRMTRYAVDEDPNNIAYRDSLGWALFQAGQYAEAADQLRKAATDESPDGVILDHLGDALIRTEAGEAAVDAWRRALKVLDESETERRGRIEQKIEQVNNHS